MRFEYIMSGDLVKFNPLVQQKAHEFPDAAAWVGEPTIIDAVYARLIHGASERIPSAV